MTRDQMIEIAKQAGIDVNWIPKIPQLPDFLERFAKLIEDSEREACANIAESSNDKYEGIPMGRCIAIDVRTRNNKLEA